ncbi:MAG: DNA primase [Proteobacteria bacterium]|nr:DNA primase [Pseudomonadota bacterium]MDA0844641.1 DNA primase [Pseudomonadota bacterium]
MAVPPEFIEDLRQRVPLSDIIGRRVKLIRKGRRFSGLCPFHSEKTPSFSVVDDDGFYHCFGCGAHGDAISFLREIDGLDFMEAVERLADMAGLVMPKSTQIDPAVTRQRKAAFDILEETTRFFEDRLRADEGRDAAQYIKQRGLDAATVKNFRLGYAPRSGLQAVLAGKGFSDDDMILAGVLGKSDRDGRLYDYFRDRVLFPIENRQGKVIAFGARALGDAQPKYLNSADSSTFSKKAVLYGWVQAREAVRRKLPLVVVEGYMDVIAVQRSGIAAAVAPLGTALTPEQIALLWKLHDEPILCFDGDAAGQRAQLRALERILPLLEPGRSARLAMLPAGKDPDDVLGESGPEGLRKILVNAQALVDVVWSTTAAQFDTQQPETRAQFWQAVRGLVRSIGNNQVRGAYGDEIESRIAAMRSQTRGQTNIFMARRTIRPATGLMHRHRAILALILAHPALVPANFEALSMLEIANQKLDHVKKAVIDAVIRDPDLDVAALNYHLQGLDLGSVIEDLTGDEMKSRLPFDPYALAPERAGAHLEELLGLVDGKSGLFSKTHTPRI